MLAPLALTLVSAGCGSGPSEAGGPYEAGGPVDGEGRGPHTSFPWFAVEPAGDPDVLSLRYWGPVADCGYRVEAEHEVAEDGVVEATIYGYPGADARPTDECDWTEQRIALALDRPLGDAPLRRGAAGFTVHRTSDGTYEPIAGTTSCGRPDCSTPSPDPAPCDSAAIRAAFTREIDGGLRFGGEERCDGSFLVVDIDVGSGGCPPTEGVEESPCRNVKRAYFVANAGEWRIVTYGQGETCEDVLHQAGLRFPDALC